MKKILSLIFLTMISFSFIKTSYAYETICKYQSGNNNITIEYDEESEKYLFAYNYDEYYKYLNISSIKTGVIGMSVLEPSLILDDGSANNLKDANNMKCPTYAFWDSTEKDFCFSNSNGCDNISGHSFTRFTNSSDYTSGDVTEVLVCESQGNELSYTAGDTDFRITIDSQNGVNIYYKSNNSSWQSMSSSQLYVNVKNNNGNSTGAYFNNNNLSAPIANRQAFNNLYLQLSENATRCPDMQFAYSGGNYFVYLENSFDDEFIYGKQETDQDDDYLTDDLDTDFEFEVEDCESYLGNPTDPGSPAYYLDFIFDLIKYAAIVILIVLTIIEFVKASASSNQDAMKKAIQKSVKRLLIAVIIFFVPILINFLLELFGIISATDCGIN